MLRSLFWVALLGAGLWSGAACQADEPLARDYYWDVSDRGADGDQRQLAYLTSLRISRVHLWLNGNENTLSCGSTWSYTEGGGRLWTATRLEEFSRALKAAGIDPIFTLSPRLRTKSYIASLSSSDGPLGVAARVGHVAIELDIEGNGDSRTKCPHDGLSADDADTAILAAIRRASPGIDVIVTTVPHYANRHPVLMADGGAEVISPQLYGAHYGYSLAAATSTLKDFLRRYPTKKILPGLSVECSATDESHHRCSESLFTAQIGMVAESAKANGSRISRYVVWGEREMFPCPHSPLCSTYGRSYMSGN